jgi:hypothetical protein
MGNYIKQTKRKDEEQQKNKERLNNIRHDIKKGYEELKRKIIN